MRSSLHVPHRPIVHRHAKVHPGTQIVVNTGLPTVGHSSSCRESAAVGAPVGVHSPAVTCTACYTRVGLYRECK